MTFLPYFVYFLVKWNGVACHYCVWLVLLSWMLTAVVEVLTHLDCSFWKSFGLLVAWGRHLLVLIVSFILKSWLHLILLCLFSRLSSILILFMFSLLSWNRLVQWSLAFIIILMKNVFFLWLMMLRGIIMFLVPNNSLLLILRIELLKGLSRFLIIKGLSRSLL